MSGRAWLALDRAADDAADEVALQEDVGDDQRGGDDHGGGREKPPLARVGALEGEEPERDRGLRGVRQEDGGEDDVVPHADRLQDEDRGDAASSNSRGSEREKPAMRIGPTPMPAAMIRM